MSTREIAYGILDKLTDEQLKGFILLFGGEIAEDVPNAETLEAIEEVEEMKKNPDKHKGYTDVDEMMRDMLG